MKPPDDLGHLAPAAVAVLVRELFVEGGDMRWALADVVKRGAKLRLSRDHFDQVRSWIALS